MKAPICKICLNSDILCSGCQSKLETGAINFHDVDLARAMSRLSERYSVLEKAEFCRTIGNNDVIVVIVPKGMAGHFIGRNGIFIKEISKELNKKIKIVEDTTNNKEIVQKIIFPAKLLGVNVMYGSGGSELFKIRVSKIDRKKFPDTKMFEDIFSEVLNGKASIIFE